MWGTQNPRTLLRQHQQRLIRAVSSSTRKGGVWGTRRITGRLEDVDWTGENVRPATTKPCLGYLGVEFLESSWERCMAKSTNERTAMPVGPLADQGLLSSYQAVPAMSR